MNAPNDTMKKILVTGAKGFMGRNICLALEREKYTVLAADIETKDTALEAYIAESDALIHCAGVNRPKNEEDFTKGNYDFTVSIIKSLKKHRKKIPVFFSSSIQAGFDNPYGRSKKKAEEALTAFAKENGSPLYIYRFCNVFGKWCNPNYNSAVATFCHNISHDLDVSISDEKNVVELVHIGDIVRELVSRLKQAPPLQSAYFYSVPEKYSITLGELVKKIRGFHDCLKSTYVPDLSDPFDRKLLSTLLSYYEPEQLTVKPDVKSDDRGWLFEFIKSKQAGQIFISKTKPGITRGNHYHDTKIEKFCLVSGEASIGLRKIGSDRIHEFRVSDKDIRTVDIPPGYTHSITNTGATDAIVLFWANEILDPKAPDTYRENVKP